MISPISDPPAAGAAPLFTLQFPADAFFAAPLAGLVEQLAVRHGLGEARAGQLTLATEELVAHLAPALAGRPISAGLETTATGLALRFTIPEQRIDLRHFNLATDRSEFVADADAAGLGLYLAARMVDDLAVEIAAGRITITLRHDRPFPEVAAVPPPTALAGGPVLVTALTADLLELACAQTLAATPPEAREGLVATPARLAALKSAGGYDMVLAADAAGRVAGWLYWALPTQRSARFFGPYVFGDRREETARLLCEGMLARLGRTAVQSVCAGRATVDTPRELFERIQFPGDAAPPQLLRQIQEDAGGVIRCPEALRGVLEKVYDELFLVRDLVPAPALESLPVGASVLGVEFDRPGRQATLRPLVAGADLAANIAAHVALLRREGMGRILARCDLHHGWQAAAAGVFHAAGFVAVGLEPGAGAGDILVLAHHG